MKVVEVYKPCEYCKGRGLEWDGKYSADCQHCQGHGKVIETRKEIVDERELPTRSV